MKNVKFILLVVSFFVVGFFVYKNIILNKQKSLKKDVSSNIPVSLNTNISNEEEEPSEDIEIQDKKVDTKPEIKKESINNVEKKLVKKIIPKKELKKIKYIKLVKPKNNKIYFGAFPDFGGTEDHVSAKKVKDFEKLVGRKIKWAYFSQNFYNGLDFPKNEISEIRKAGAIPFVRFLPHPKEYYEYASDMKKVENEFSLEKIIEGVFDKELKKWAQNAKADGKMILVDFAVEPNGDWFVWSGKYHGGGVSDKYGNTKYPDGPEKWRDAYRHIIDLFKEEKVNNITWFFHADINSVPDEWWNKPKYYYPGDQYIDWIGVSIYGPQNDREDYWDTFSEILKERSKYILEISKTKPFALLEFGVSDSNPNGDKSLWLEDAFKTIVEKQYIPFSAISYWHENWEEEDGEKALIRVDSSEKSLKTFQNIIKNKIFDN